MGDPFKECADRDAFWGLDLNQDMFANVTVDYQRRRAALLGDMTPSPGLTDTSSLDSESPYITSPTLQNSHPNELDKYINIDEALATFFPHNTLETNNNYHGVRNDLDCGATSDTTYMYAPEPTDFTTYVPEQYEHYLPHHEPQITRQQEIPYNYAAQAYFEKPMVERSLTVDPTKIVLPPLSNQSSQSSSPNSLASPPKGIPNTLSETTFEELFGFQECRTQQRVIEHPRPYERYEVVVPEHTVMPTAVQTHHLLPPSSSTALDPRVFHAPHPNHVPIHHEPIPEPQQLAPAPESFPSLRSKSVRKRKREPSPSDYDSDSEDDLQQATQSSPPPSPSKRQRLAKAELEGNFNAAAVPTSPSFGADEEDHDHDHDAEDSSDSDPDWEPGLARTPKRSSPRSRSLGSANSFANPLSQTISGVPSSPSSTHSSSRKLSKPSGNSARSSSKKKSDHGDRAFWCYSCDRGFSRAADKERHLETYHKLQGIPCHICKGTFSRADALRRHLLKGCSGKARKRRSRAWELAAQRAAQGQQDKVKPPPPPELARMLSGPQV